MCQQLIIRIRINNYSWREIKIINIFLKIRIELVIQIFDTVKLEFEVKWTLLNWNCKQISNYFPQVNYRRFTALLYI